MKWILYALTFVALLLLTLPLGAQHTLSGSVVDEQGQPIDVGNVLLLAPVDSALVLGDLFLDGAFKIEGVASEPYLLKITALGYEAFHQMIEPPSNKASLYLGKIQLQQQLLEGVEVIAQRSLFEQKGSDLTVNVANTALSNAGSAMDVLRNSPKVLINSGGQISVIGKGSALIYVDGQQIASTQILENLTSNELKRIEIIDNPGAKYDAAGNAVINIITKSGALNGFKVGLVQEVGQGKHFRSFFRGDVYYKLSKWLFQTSYGARPWTMGGREYYFRTYELNEVLTEVDNKLEYSRKLFTQDFNFRSVYQINANSKLGMQYTTLFTDGEKDAANSNIYNENKETAFNLDTDITGPYDQNSHTVNAYYEWNWDTLGSNLFLTSQYSNFDLERLENINQFYESEPVGEFLNKRTFNTNAIDVFTAQLDIHKVFPNGMQVKTGIKNANIANRSLLRFESQLADGTYQREAEASSDYDYSENILAAYGELDWSNERTQIKAGLRAEWTHVDRASEATAFETQSYINYFPSASISQAISDDSRWSLSYGRRIQRPQFQDLNPFVFYVDSLVSLRGNPTLVPAFSDAISASLAINKWSFNLNYTHTSNPINTIIQVEDFDNPGTFAFIRDNIKSTDLYAVSVAYPFSYKSYSAYFMLGARYEDHRVEDVGSLLENRKAGYYLYTNQSVQLPGAIKLEMIYQYTSPRVDGIYVDNPVSFFHIGLTRKFFNDHLQVRFWANDIFDRYKFRGISNFNQSHFTYLSEGDWHFYKITFNWNFGKLGTGGFNNKKVSSDELNRINRN
ncbi:MAG: outer membrane beta-barrel protein [Bacteroidota bacterium]